ncbi:hypothetical protein G7Y79_00017g041900 [Physcia stellaris]|nr:hypothetical protein G7Y79_00017g041900 [Physcia stellaris]
MLPLTFWPYFLSIIVFPLPTLQVNVRHSFFRGNADCNNLLPGVCCLAIPPKPQRIFPGDRYPDYPWSVEVSSLYANEIAAVWEKRGDAEGCSGTPARTMIAPPSTFHTYYWGDFGTGVHKRFTGASYILLPKTLPPTGSSSLWLGAEGLLALAWGGGKWVSERGRNAGLTGLGGLRRRSMNPNEATAYLAPPAWWRYPDVITINGTDYLSSNTSALDYHDIDGHVVDLASIGL